MKCLIPPLLAVLHSTKQGQSSLVETESSQYFENPRDQLATSSVHKPRPTASSWRHRRLSQRRLLPFGLWPHLQPGVLTAKGKPMLPKPPNVPIPNFFKGKSIDLSKKEYAARGFGRNVELKNVHNVISFLHDVQVALGSFLEQLHALAGIMLPNLQSSTIDWRQDTMATLSQVVIYYCSTTNNPPRLCTCRYCKILPIGLLLCHLTTLSGVLTGIKTMIVFLLRQKYSMLLHLQTQHICGKWNCALCAKLWILWFVISQQCICFYCNLPKNRHYRRQSLANRVDKSDRIHLRSKILPLIRQW